MRTIFIAGGTGYLGGALVRGLLARGHRVRALARTGSDSKLPAGCEVAPGSALDAASYERALAGCDTQVHLVGVSHPSPWKAQEFQRVDVGSVRAATTHSRAAGIQHFVYVSVAHPAPMMRAYIAARTACEAIIGSAGVNATIVRPWYVLGPGHWWPCALIPFYKLFEKIPSKRETALRLGLVTHAQMIRTLVAAIENPVIGKRVIEVPQIRTGEVSAKAAAC